MRTCGTTRQSRHAARILFHVSELPTCGRGRNSTRTLPLRLWGRTNDLNCKHNPCTHRNRQKAALASSAAYSRYVCVAPLSMVRTSSRIACAGIEACTRQMRRLVFRISLLSYHNILNSPCKSLNVHGRKKISGTRTLSGRKAKNGQWERGAATTQHPRTMHSVCQPQHTRELSQRYEFITLLHVIIAVPVQVFWGVFSSYNHTLLLLYFHTFILSVQTN